MKQPIVETREKAVKAPFVAPSPAAVPVVVMPGAHKFVQFNAPVVVHDIRGQEELTDRATVGMALGPHGSPVESITLEGDWFTLVAGAGLYLVPVQNVRSARR